MAVKRPRCSPEFPAYIGGGRAGAEPPESSSDIRDCFPVSIDLLAHVDMVWTGGGLLPEVIGAALFG